MAYGLKYELWCASKDGFTYKLRLLFDGYVGAEINRDIPVDSPLVLRKDKSAVIRGTSCEFAIRENVDFEMDEFYTNNSKKIKAELYRGATLIWTGYNLPQQYQAPYISAPLNVRFTATDGLGLLKNEKFNLTERNSQLATIIYCIDKIGLGLSYSIAVNLFETNHIHDRSPLAQTYEDASCYNGKYCNEVIEDILSKYDAEITQVNNTWYITRSADKKSARMLYSTAGVYTGVAAIPTVLNLGYKGAGIDVSPVGRLARAMEPGAKKVTLSFDFGRKASFLKNYDFWRFSGGQFEDWTQSGSFILRQDIKDGKAYAFMGGYSADPNDGISQEIPITKVIGDDFVFEIDFAPVGSTRTTLSSGSVLMAVKMVVALSDGTTTYFLTKEGWSTTLQMIEETVKSSVSSPVWNKVRIITGELPISGTLLVSLSRYFFSGTPPASYSYNGVAFSEPLIYFLRGGQLYASGLKAVATFDNSTEPGDMGEVSLVTADAPDYANKALLFKNITWLLNGSPTGEWHVLGDASYYSMFVQLARILASNNRIARQKLSGTLRGTGVNLNSIIKHTYNGNREFEISEGQWDIYNATYQVTLLELLVWSSQAITFADEGSPTTQSQSGSRSESSIRGTVTTNDSGGQALMTGADILTKLCEVDGAGSGLDADLLDGQHGDYYFLTAAQILTKLLTVDGAGSALDADFLDGQHGSFYAPINSPVFITNITTPFIYGSSAANGNLSIHGTSHATKTNSILALQTIGGNVTIGNAASLININGKAYLTDTTNTALTNYGGLTKNNYVSQLTGYRVSAAGEADFRYLYADEMHVKSFIADLEQALAGGQIISKSVAKVAADFTIPAAGAAGSLVVEEFAGFTGAVFVNGDMIRLRQFTRANNTSLNVSDVWGTVVYVSRNSAANPTTQTFTFTRSSGGNAGNGTGVIKTGTLALDYGTTGTGYYEVTAVDGLNGVNSPYAQFITWTGHPVTGLTLKTRIGNLAGITDAAFGGALTGYGLYADNVYLKGKIVISGGSSGYINIVDKPTNLAGINAAEGGKLGGIAAGATVGATSSQLTTLNNSINTAATTANWALLGGKPYRFTDTPAGAGLLMTATCMGYYDGGAWKSYIDNAGNCKFIGASEFGTSVLNIDGYTTSGSVAMKGNHLWENSQDNAAGTLYLNYLGFAGGMTQYRDTLIGNGRGGYIALFDGSSSRVDFQNTVYAGGNITAPDFALSSDLRKKTKILPIENDPITSQYFQYELLTEPGRKRYGKIAQDLQIDHPELVQTDEHGMLSISYTDLHNIEISYLNNEVKRMMEKIIKLEKRLQ